MFAAAVVPKVNDWLALSLEEVSVIEPLLANVAVNPMPAVVSAALKASSELTLPAPVPRVMVVAAPVAGVKTKVLPLSEFVPATVKSVAVPATLKGPAPVGAKLVAEAFTS